MNTSFTIAQSGAFTLLGLHRPSGMRFAILNPSRNITKFYGDLNAAQAAFNTFTGA